MTRLSKACSRQSQQNRSRRRQFRDQKRNPRPRSALKTSPRALETQISSGSCRTVRRVAVTSRASPWSIRTVQRESGSALSRERHRQTCKQSAKLHGSKSTTLPASLPRQLGRVGTTQMHQATEQAARPTFIRRSGALKPRNCCFLRRKKRDETRNRGRSCRNRRPRTRRARRIRSKTQPSPSRRDHNSCRRCGKGKNCRRYWQQDCTSRSAC